jgi:hypothetical protein
VHSLAVTQAQVNASHEVVCVLGRRTPPDIPSNEPGANPCGVPSEHGDAGILIGERIDRERIAVRIGLDQDPAGAPAIELA